MSASAASTESTRTVAVNHPRLGRVDCPLVYGPRGPWAVVQATERDACQVVHVPSGNVLIAQQVASPFIQSSDVAIGLCRHMFEHAPTFGEGWSFGDERGGPETEAMFDAADTYEARP